MVGTNLDNYTINKQCGKLKINKLTATLTVTANDASKPYDGTALTQSDYSYTDGVIQTRDTLSAETEGSIINYGNTPNTIKTISITRDGVDVSYNYENIKKSAGTLTITKRPITVKSKDGI